MWVQSVRELSGRKRKTSPETPPVLEHVQTITVAFAPEAGAGDTHSDCGGDVAIKPRSSDSASGPKSSSVESGMVDLAFSD